MMTGSNYCIFMYLGKTQMNGCSFRDVHDFAVRCNYEYEAIQSLKMEETIQFLIWDREY